MKPTAQELDAGKFEDELKPGTELLHGQYVIEKFLNNGGFGITYLAKDSLHRRVVIKECFPESICRRSNATVGVRSRNQVEAFRTIVELFIEEARKLARLSHPNIVGVHQVFEDNDTAYMAMDFVEGRDLLEIVESGSALAPATLERIVVKLLDAIEFIHKQGLLHRDISPDNILINKNNQPVLIDFGAARETVTRATRFLGSMRTVKDGYSPQEFYVTGSDQFPSSDLYSLAASLYHVLTREVPVSAQERLSAIAGGDGDSYVSIKERVTGYPEPFLDAIDQALNVFPKNRIQSAAEWRAMITQSSVSRATRGTVSQPVLAVDNGNILEQFEERKPKPVIGGLRRPDAKTQPLAADELADQPPASASTPNDKALNDLAAVPAKKSAGGGLLLGVAAVALMAAVGAGVFLMTGGDTGTDAVFADTSLEETAPPDVPGAVEVAENVAPETPARPPVVFAAPSSDPLPWEVPQANASADSEAISEDSSPVETVDASEEKAAVEELAAAGTEPAAITGSGIRDASAVLVGKAIEFPVFADPADPTLVALSSGAAGKHLKPGLRIVSVNGFPIASLDEFQRVANATTSYEIGETVEFRIGIEDPSTGNTFVRKVELPAVRQTMLLNGVSFETTRTGEAWTTLVTTGTGREGSDLQPGDRIVALMPDNELIDTQDALQRVIEREIEGGNTQFNFAVERDGSMWFATMRYGAAIAN